MNSEKLKKLAKIMYPHDLFSQARSHIAFRLGVVAHIMHIRILMRMLTILLILTFIAQYQEKHLLFRHCLFTTWTNKFIKSHNVYWILMHKCIANYYYCNICCVLSLQHYCAVSKNTIVTWFAKRLTISSYTSTSKRNWSRHDHL